MTPREAGIQAFYADESTSNTLQGLNAAFDAYEATAKPIQGDLVKALESLVECHDAFQASYGNMEDAYYKLAKYAYPHWEAARAALSQAKEG